MSADEKTSLLDNVVGVDKRQFKGYPTSTLYCAQATKMLVIFGVTLTITALVLAFSAGAVSVDSVTVKHSELPFSRAVICPSWGQEGMTLDVKGVEVGNLFTSSYPTWKPVGFTSATCPPFKYYKFKREKPFLATMTELEAVNKMGCVCIDQNLTLAARDVGKDFVKVALSASFEIDPTKMLSIGFNDGGDDYPGDWNYVGLGVRTVGDLTLEENIYGRTPLTQGDSVKLFTMGVKNVLPLPESQMVKGADTEVVLSFGSYYENQILDIAAIFSIFGILSFVAIIVATLNSLQVFNLCFPDKVNEDDPQQLEPAWIFQVSCGSCFSCCRPRDSN